MLMSRCRAVAVAAPSSRTSTRARVPTARSRSVPDSRRAGHSCLTTQLHSPFLERGMSAHTLCENRRAAHAGSKAAEPERRWLPRSASAWYTGPSLASIKNCPHARRPLADMSIGMRFNCGNGAAIPSGRSTAAWYQSRGEKSRATESRNRSTAGRLRYCKGSYSVQCARSAWKSCSSSVASASLYSTAFNS